MRQIRCFAVVSLLLPLTLALPARAQDARLESLGGADLFVEDASNIYANPALAAVYSNRAFFSLGITGGGGAVGFDPSGGGFVRIKDTVTLGLVLNRSPLNYDFGNAFWPVLETYIPEGPGGALEGPDGPVETTAPLRFPADLFVAFGNQWSPLRVGVNVYYAGGAERFWEIDDADQDDLEESLTTKKQTHLISGTVGLSGGSLADNVRGEGWVRVTFASAWHDEQASVELTPGETEQTIDRIVSLDRDMRIGGGIRFNVGDVEQGFVVSPALRYDTAFGVFRFDDNLVAPDSSAENAQRNSTAHDLTAGVGVAWRNDGLLIHGSASVGVTSLEVIDTLDDDGGIDRTTTSGVELSAPEVSIGAEYRVLPPLLIRAGIRSSVVGGRDIGTIRTAVGDDDSPFETDVIQTVGTTPVGVNLAATAGLGLEVKRFRADAIVGGLLLGGPEVSFFSRIDLGFDFD